MGDYNTYTDEELLEILREFNKNVEFPTQRKFKTSLGLPSSVTYFNRFGSFQNAIILAGIEIPNDKKRYFNRKKYSKEYILKVFKEQVEISISKRNKLITDDEIDLNPCLPSSSVYYRHFKTLDNLYAAIGINKRDFNNKQLEEDMKLKYIEIRHIIGRTPHSRDLDDFSRRNNKYYGITTYLDHFESVQNLQTLMGDKPTNWGSLLSDEELLMLLVNLKDDLGIVPTQNDVCLCDYTPSYSVYRDRFGSFVKAIKKAGLTPRSNRESLITKMGNKALSGYEYKFMIMLEENNIAYNKEEFYSQYIKTFNKKYRFDFTIPYNGELYFVEIFGIDANDNYDKKTYEKIQLCKDNNLKLIELYGRDFKGNVKDLYNLFMNKIKEVI